MNFKRIILASASPRRTEIFKNHHINAEIIPADVDESLPEGISAENAVMFLALKKALYVEQLILQELSEKSETKNSGANDSNNILIVAADTVVYKDNVLCKPETENDAFEMLKTLRAASHFVMTGVAAIVAGTSKRTVFYDTTEVQFKDYTDNEIHEYIATGEPMDKAGAYAIQGGFGKHVDNYFGSYENIVGFPWEKFKKTILEK